MKYDFRSLETFFTAEPNPKVTWFINGMESQPTNRILHVQEKERACLTILKVNLQDSGVYVCKAVNTLGESSCRTKLTVIRMCIFIPLRNFNFSIEIYPLADEKHRQGNEGAVVTTSEETFSVTEQTTTKATMKETDKATALAMKHPGIMSEPCAVISAPLELKNTDHAPKFIEPLEDVATEDGSNIVLSTKFISSPQPTITWFFNKQPIKENQDFQVRTGEKTGQSDLVISEVYPEDDGEYSVLAENPFGSDYTVCYLHVTCK